MKALDKTQNNMKLETRVKEFTLAEFEQRIDGIIAQLSDKDCTNIEFLRGYLAAYKELIDNTAGWNLKVYNYFR